MKSIRIGIVVMLVLAVVSVVFFWSRNGEQSAAAPGACVEAFYNASLDRDQERMARCVADTLQNQTEQLATEKDGLLSFVQVQQEISSETAWVDVDEIRDGSGEARRIRFQLEKENGGWRITRIGSPQSVKMNVPAGTPVSEVPEP